METPNFGLLQLNGSQNNIPGEPRTQNIPSAPQASAGNALEGLLGGSGDGKSPISGLLNGLFGKSPLQAANKVIGAKLGLNDGGEQGGFNTGQPIAPDSGLKPNPGYVAPQQKIQNTAPMPPAPQLAGTTSLGTSNPHSDLQATLAGIAGVESGGAKNPYTVTSIPSRNGDRAYGKYQIMGSNIPSWTKEATGKAMTPEEFLHNPEAQEKTASYMINKNLSKGYSPQDAASIWFSGRPMKQAGNSRDAYGTTVKAYIEKFNKGYGAYNNSPNSSTKDSGELEW